MATLADKQIKNAYVGLLKTGDNGDLSANSGASAINITDGIGTGTAISLSTDRVGIGTDAPDEVLDVRSTVAGGVTTIRLVNEDVSTSTTEFCSIDAMIHTAERNAGRIKFNKIDTYADAGTSDSSMGFYTSKDDSNVLAMTIDEDQNVGIGTATPDSSLEISKAINGRFTALKLTNESDATDATGYVSIGFDLEDNSGTPITSGYINCVKEQTFTSTPGTRDSYISFETADNGTLSEKVWIKSDGKVGIGTSAPLTKLHVGGNAHHVLIDVESDDPYIRLTSTSNAGEGATILYDSASEDLYLGVGYATGADIIFKSQYLDTSIVDNGVEHMRIVGQTGDVGIGITPTHPLHVVGNADNNEMVYIKNSDYSNITSEGLGIEVCSTGTSVGDEIFLKCYRGSATHNGSIRNASSTTLEFVAASDERLKADIVDAEVNAIELINKLRFREFTWKMSNEYVPIGLIGQEVQETGIPNMVSESSLEKGMDEYITDDDKYLMLGDGYLRYYMAKAIQELSAEVEKLKAK